MHIFFIRKKKKKENCQDSAHTKKFFECFDAVQKSSIFRVILLYIFFKKISPLSYPFFIFNIISNESIKRGIQVNIK